MAQMNSTPKPSVETGAFTVVLLARLYRSQMTALLLRNGIAVPEGATDQDLAFTIAELLKVSRSFNRDILLFLSNPAVAKTIAEALSGNAQYFRMSGSGFMNAGGFVAPTSPLPMSVLDNQQIGIDLGTTDTGATTATEGDDEPKWYDSIKNNLGNYLSDTVKLFGQLDTNKTQREIARSQSTIAMYQAQAGGGSTTSTLGGTPQKDGMSTTTIVLVSVVGLVLIGGLFYMLSRPKN
jgi:hypothetical protein